MFQILRKTFPERILDCAELARLAMMWRAFFRMWLGKREHESGTEVMLWGFPRRDGAALTSRIAAMISAGELAGYGVSQPHPDWITIRSPLSRNSDPDTGEAWTSLLRAPELEGLLLIAMVIMRSDAPARHRSATIGRLMAIGAIAAGRLQLKTLFPVDAYALRECMWQFQLWDGEDLLLCELRELADAAESSSSQKAQRLEQLLIESRHPTVEPRDRPYADAWRRRQLSTPFWFARTASISWTKVLLRTLFEVPDNARPLPFLLWRILPGGGLLFCAMALHFLRQPSLDIVAIGLGIVGLLVSTVSLGWRALWVFTCRKRMREGLGKLYSGPIRWTRVPFPPELSTNPAAAKFRVDAEELGLVFQCGVDMGIGRQFPAVVLLFQSPDRTTAAMLSLMYHNGEKSVYPPQLLWAVETHFTDGNRVFTANGDDGYRKTSPAPVIIQSASWTDSISELLTLHRARVEELILAGHEPLSPSVDEFFDLQAQLHERSREWWKVNPYGWSDALHQAFKVGRRDPRVRVVPPPDGNDVARILGLTEERSSW